MYVRDFLVLVHVCYFVASASLNVQILLVLVFPIKKRMRLSTYFFGIAAVAWIW
jgi:hypothetical protein